jgi:vitamin B12 transporter
MRYLAALAVVSSVVLLPGVHPAAVMAQQDALSLDGLIVTASPTPRSAESVASHVTILDGEALRVGGFATVGEALREVPGLDVVRNGSFGAITSVFLRGGESDHVLVLVDGVQVNQAGGGFDFASLTTDNVERIEIVRGAASALYGSDAMAGVIHVLTRIGRGSPRLGASVQTASYSEPRDELIDGVRWSADLVGGSERFGYSASFGREASDGILAFNNRSLSTVISGNARFVPDDATGLALTLRLTDREFHYPTDGSGQVVDRNAFGFGDETLATVTLTRSVTQALELRAMVAVHETDSGTDDEPDDASDTEGFKSLDHFRRSLAELRASATLGTVVLTVGGEVEEERQRSFSESTSAFGTSFGRSESERENLAAFAHLAGSRGVLAFNAGARVEDNERFGSGATWQAGVAAHHPSRARTRVRASIGTAIKEPTFFENFATGFATGNPELDPERSLAWEAGLEHALTDGVSLQVTYFDQRLEDLIQYTAAPPSPSDPNFYNVAEASTRGVEAGAELRLGGLEVGADYTWLDTRVENPGFDSGPEATFVDGEALLRRPTNTLALRATGPVSRRVRVHTRLSFVGERADRSFDPVTFAATRQRLESYLLWSLGGEWDVSPAGPGGLSVTLFARGENLLGASYEEVWGFRAPGRQMYIGARMAIGGDR